MTNIFNYINCKNVIQKSKTKSLINFDKCNLFDIDSAHDILFDESLAVVTSNCFGNIPAGVTGEDRYIWYLKDNENLYSNIKYFSVLERKKKK